MAGGARGRGVAFAHHFGGPQVGGGPPQNLASAFAGMKDLIQEYDNIQLSTLKDL